MGGHAGGCGFKYQVDVKTLECKQSQSRSEVFNTCTLWARRQKELTIRRLIHFILGVFGYGVVTSAEKKALHLNGFGIMWVKELISRASLISGREVVWEDSRLQKFESQLGQDLVAIGLFGLEHKGYFVEFGATNGKELSNTWILEKQFGWTGILCEPAKTWHGQLLRNRSCTIDLRCVSNDSGRIVRFSETKVGELSTISSYTDRDMHANSRARAKEYVVETVSLNDLLTQHDAPRDIDFLSIDTEGSELDILTGFDFSAYSFGLICVEHNYSGQRDGIRSLLNSNGYRQILPEYSFFDDWYINGKIWKS